MQNKLLPRRFLKLSLIFNLYLLYMFSFPTFTFCSLKQGSFFCKRASCSCFTDAILSLVSDERYQVFQYFLLFYALLFPFPILFLPVFCVRGFPWMAGDSMKKQGLLTMEYHCTVIKQRPSLLNGGLFHQISISACLFSQASHCSREESSNLLPGDIRLAVSLREKKLNSLICSFTQQIFTEHL